MSEAQEIRSYEGRSINKLQNGIILLIFIIYNSVNWRNMKNPIYRFCM